MRRSPVFRAVSVSAVFLCGALLAVPCWPGPPKETGDTGFGLLSPGPFYRMKLCGRDACCNEPTGPEVWLCNQPVNPEFTCGCIPHWVALNDLLAQEPDSGCGRMPGEPWFFHEFYDRPENIYSYKLRMAVKVSGVIGPVKTSDWVNEPTMTIQKVCAKFVGLDGNGNYLVEVTTWIWQGGLPRARDPVTITLR